MKKTILLILCLSFLHLQAATYYASPNGTGNGSSYNTPCSFSNGLGKLQAGGDTLWLLGGQYDLDNVKFSKSGNATRRIVIAGVEGEKAILDFRSTPYGTRGLQTSGDYIHVRNLTLRYSGKNNLLHSGSHSLFERLDIYGSADTGCQMKGGGGNTILNVDSHDNFDYQTVTKEGKANFGGNADGFADKQFTAGGNHYIGCRAWGNSDDGWDFFQRYSTTQTVIENCICYQNGPAYYDMRNHPRYETDRAWFDSKVGTTVVDRYKNTVTVTLAQYPCQGNGNGFKMGGGDTETGGSQHNLLIHHCLSVANNARGFDQNNNGGNMLIYNNTSYANEQNYGFTTAYGTNTLRNNISYKSKSNDRYSAQTVQGNDHNSWNSGFNVSNSDFLSLDTTQILAPRQADGTLAEGTCLHLASNSSLIDAGVNLNLGHNGSAPDLGCYEDDGEEHTPDPGPDPDPEPEQDEHAHHVAYVTEPGSEEDLPLLRHLQRCDSLYVVETDATDATVDYSDYELLILSSKPASTAAGLMALEGYHKPIVLLKPFLLKPTAWDWGTAINTQDLSVTVTDPTHPLFRNIPLGADNSLPLFSRCITNAVTAMSAWSNTESFSLLATPISHPDYTAIAHFPAGTDCNGTVLTHPLLLIGLSEYSTAYLTDEAKQLVENAACLLLGVEIATGITAVESHCEVVKILTPSGLRIRRGAHTYTFSGIRID